MKQNKNFILILFLITVPNTLILSMENNENKKMLHMCLHQEYKNELKVLAKNAQNPHEICIPLWHNKSITSSATMSTPITISAYGLEELYGLHYTTITGILVSYTNKEQFAGITHYPNASLEKQTVAIKKQCSEIYDAQHKNKKISTIHFFIANYTGRLSATRQHLEDVIYEALYTEKEKITIKLALYYKTNKLLEHQKPLKIILDQEKAHIKYYDRTREKTKTITLS